jgi:hypothetical protein
MKKNITLEKIEKNIDFIDLVILLWKDRAIFFAITLLTTFSILLFVLINLNKYETQVRLNDPPNKLFSKYDLFSFSTNSITTQDNFSFSTNSITTQDNEEIQYSLINDYIIELRKKIASIDNLFDYKKKFNIKKNLRVQQLFVNKKLSNNFVLVFPKEINGPDILNDYIEFTKYKVLDETKNKIKKI